MLAIGKFPGGELSFFGFFRFGSSTFRIAYLYLARIYEKVHSENISTLTKTLLNRALNKSNGPESNEKEREKGKEEGEKKKTTLEKVKVTH